MSKKKDLEKLKKREAKIALEQQQSAEVWSLAREFADHPARGLTPQKLYNILTAAEQGDIVAQSNLFLDMEERDGHIYCEMSKRKRALLTLDWHIEPPKNATTAEKALAAEAQEWLENIDDFEDVMLDALDGIGHGFAALEVEWELLGNLQLPCKFHHRPQSWFQTPIDNLNDLRLRDGTMEGAELWPLGWLVHKHKAKSGYLTRSGLHRVLCWPYLFKNYSVRDLAEFLEIYGLPLRLGKYPSGATEKEKTTLLRAVTQIGHAAAGIIPQGMMIDFQEAAKGSHDPFQAMIDWCEKTQSKAILGGTLTTQADGKTSTNALGNVHNEVRHDLLTADAKQLSSTLTRGLIIPLLSINKAGFDPSRAPRFVFNTQEPEDIKLFSEAIPKLVGVGMQIPTQWAHEKLGIPLPENDTVAVLKSGTSQNSPTAALSTVVAALKQEPLAPSSNPTEDDKVTKNASVLFELIDKIPDEKLQSVIEPLLLPVISKLKSASNENERLSVLAEAYPTMDDGQLIETLGDLLFIADLWGRLSVQEELGQ
ncbi:DUF935 domain-containing protein [Agitococcus lubricus]|uniref:Phage gp29-like protein n=1 Tax=Agitococcus lubricus TaxID=1077255 RepID=A0A2T5J441_9GAMM|nr:DUF935 family protein [Agitococcus lubricus]PTQ91263.1 phage gp29-like protein [Agitococcus lubricus]